MENVSNTSHLVCSLAHIRHLNYFMFHLHQLQLLQRSPSIHKPKYLSNNKEENIIICHFQLDQVDHKAYRARRQDCSSRTHSVALGDTITSLLTPGHICLTVSSCKIHRTRDFQCLDRQSRLTGQGTKLLKCPIQAHQTTCLKQAA